MSPTDFILLPVCSRLWLDEAFELHSLSCRSYLSWQCVLLTDPHNFKFLLVLIFNYLTTAGQARPIHPDGCIFLFGPFCSICFQQSHVIHRWRCFWASLNLPGCFSFASYLDSLHVMLLTINPINCAMFL